MKNLDHFIRVQIDKEQMALDKAQRYNDHFVDALPMLITIAIGKIISFFLVQVVRPCASATNSDS